MQKRQLWCQNKKAESQIYWINPGRDDMSENTSLKLNVTHKHDSIFTLDENEQLRDTINTFYFVNFLQSS